MLTTCSSSSLRADDRHDDDARRTDDGARRNDGRVGRLLLEVLVLLLDHQRGGLGLAVDVARHDLHGAELAERAGQAEHHAVDDGPLDRRQGDPPERLHARWRRGCAPPAPARCRSPRAPARPRGSRAAATTNTVAMMMPGLGEDDLEAVRPRASGRTSRRGRCRRAPAPGRRRPATPTAAGRSAR